jgi:hypothetical protein
LSRGVERRLGQRLSRRLGCTKEETKGMGLGNLGNLDLGQLQGYLQGVNFPAGKEEVASNAESNNAPRNWSSR